VASLNRSDDASTDSSHRCQGGKQIIDYVTFATGSWYTGDDARLGRSNPLPVSWKTINDGPRCGIAAL